jgi:hypothetical protein
MKNLALSLKLSIASNRISQIEHTSNKSVHGFMLNIFGGLIAYPLKTITLQLNITNAEFGAFFYGLNRSHVNCGSTLHAGKTAKYNIFVLITSLLNY